MKIFSITYKIPVFFLTGLLLNVSSFAQTDNDSLVAEFNRYSTQNWQEKVFVHTDKSFYLTGEVVWFKAYVTDAVFNMPANQSKICYVEIINKDLKQVLQGKVEITGGSGNGSFTLPGFLTSGNYILRAYTNWMKNMGPGYFFEKNITVVNTLKNAGKAANNNDNVSVQFFPEGGQLVNGLQSTVAFNFINKNGAGVNGTGYLLNTNNDTILKFSPSRFGIGKFSFTPQKNTQYKASIKLDDGKKATVQLPFAYNEGYVMQVTNTDAAQIKVTVTSTGAAGNNTYLFIHTRNRFKALLQQQLKNGVAEFNIDKKSLEDGITQLTVFNNTRQPVCERLYFKRPSKKLDIDISPAQNSFAERSGVNVSVTTHQQQAIINDADMSVSAFLIDSLQGINEPGILTYLLLTSDLTGHIESPDWYVNNNTAEADEGIDNLMLTHGWRRLKWEDILQNKKPYFKYAAELEGPLVAGRVFDRTTGLAAKNITCYLTVPGQQFKFATDVSNNEGQLLFNIGKFYGNNQLVAQTNNQTDSNYRFDFISPFYDSFSTNSFTPLMLARQFKEQLENRTINAQAENAYLRDAKQRFNLTAHGDTSVFYGTPDKAYYLDDYTRFTTMDEVMREFVVEVRVRKPTDYNLRVKMPTAPYFFGTPLVLVDGVPVFNVNKVMESDPLKIKKIDIVTHKYYSGPLITDGVISYCSYDGSVGATLLDPNGLVVEYDGLQREREFYSPVYDAPEKLNGRIPDVRNVLYWNPNIESW